MFEWGQLWRRRKRRRSRAVNWESIMDIPQRPCNVLMYSKRRSEWSCQQVNRRWSEQDQNSSDLQEEEWEEEESSSKLGVNNGRTPASLQGLNVLDDKNRFSLPPSKSNLIRKSSKWVRPGGGWWTANWESMLDVPRGPCTGLMYSTYRIDWAYQQVNQSWSGKVRKGSVLETGRAAKQQIES